MPENDQDKLKNTLKYKFMEKLVKGKYSSNPLVSGVSKATMASFKAVHNTFGSDSDSDSDSDLIKEKINKDEQFVRKVKSIIKTTIDKYKENCEFSTNENEYNMIVILLDSIFRHTSNDSNSYKRLLKYVTEISKLACSISAKEKEYLIERYTKLLKTTTIDDKVSQDEFLKDIFNEIKTRNSPQESTSESESESTSEAVDSDRNSINTIIPPRRNRRNSRNSINTIIPPRRDTYNLLNYSSSNSLDDLNKLYGTNN